MGAGIDRVSAARSIFVSVTAGLAACGETDILRQIPGKMTPVLPCAAFSRGQVCPGAPSFT